MANGNGSNGSNGHGGLGVKVGQALEKTDEKVRGSQAWTAIFRPGSVFRRGYTDSPRNRSYVIMNNVLYHLHPVKVKRHAVKVSYTLCLGGLSFFLFVKWQDRKVKPPEDEDAETVVVGKSRFGRPLKAKV